MRFLKTLTTVVSLVTAGVLLGLISHEVLRVVIHPGTWRELRMEYVAPILSGGGVFIVFAVWVLYRSYRSTDWEYLP